MDSTRAHLTVLPVLTAGGAARATCRPRLYDGKLSSPGQAPTDGAYPCCLDTGQLPDMEFLRLTPHGMTPQCPRLAGPVFGNNDALAGVGVSSEKSIRNEKHQVATDYDEVRSDVKESQERSLEDLQSANAPDARSVVTELDESDALDEGLTPGGEIVSEELIVQVIPQGADEFTCYSCFLVRHRSQRAREADGHSYCIECES